MVTTGIIAHANASYVVWEQISFAQGRVRRLCIESLAGGPKTPMAIARAGDENLSHISRALRELEGRRLVQCLTPKARKNRIYRLTDEGQKIFEVLKQMG